LDKGLQACGGWTQFSRWLALYNYAIMGFGGAGGKIRLPENEMTSIYYEINP